LLKEGNEPVTNCNRLKMSETFEQNKIIANQGGTIVGNTENDIILFNY